MVCTLLLLCLDGLGWEVRDSFHGAGHGCWGWVRVGVVVDVGVEGVEG